MTLGGNFGLGNRDLDPGYVHLRPESVSDLLGGSCLEEEFECFEEIVARFGHGLALTGDVDFRAQRNIAIAFPLDDRCQLPLHGIASAR